ncbi:hypothetical protein [Streptomyces sp. NPDC048142]|uniref:hypothetical protein n=1 Tax=Streptomyces sp. NPDC048142 TaxID=3365501 RepID=UPI003711F58E
MTQPPASPSPSCTDAGGRVVPPSPPPEADDGKDAAENGPGPGGEGASQISGDDEKASRVPRGDTDEAGDGDEDDDQDDDDQDDDDQDGDDDEGGDDDEDGDGDDEWDD